MFKDLPALEQLVEQLRRLPYLASKNVYRVAAHFLARKPEDVSRFCTILMQARQQIKACGVCYNWTQGSQLCSICIDSTRVKGILCVVETWHDLLSVERSGEFRGGYHVLGGALCPLEGIGPDELTVDSLVKRLESPEISEVIFATNPTPEGEATASFVASKIVRSDLSMSRLASGIPMGSSLEFVDRMTIHKALAGRQPF